MHLGTVPGIVRGCCLVPLKPPKFSNDKREHRASQVVRCTRLEEFEARASFVEIRRDNTEIGHDWLLGSRRFLIGPAGPVVG